MTFNFAGSKIIYKFFKFIGTALVTLCLVAYIIMGGSAAYTFFKIKINRLDTIQVLPALVDESIKLSKPEKVSEWITQRPVSETKEIWEIVMPKSGYLNPSLFFELSRRRGGQGNLEDALFMSQLGRYRLRFDILRCGSVEGLELFDSLMAYSESKVMDDYLIQDPRRVKGSIEKVLAFDEKYPAQNDPSFICDLVDDMERVKNVRVEKERWEKLRLSLRSVTEMALKVMDKE